MLMPEALQHLINMLVHTHYVYIYDIYIYVCVCACQTWCFCGINCLANLVQENKRSNHQ